MQDKMLSDPQHDNCNHNSQEIAIPWFVRKDKFIEYAFNRPADRYNTHRDNDGDHRLMVLSE
jgi:hypothetical protein